MLNKKNIYAIVGATKDEQKYGYKVTKNLKDLGYNVIPINLREKEILGLKVYKSILDVYLHIDVVIFVVPPVVTENILRNVKKAKIDRVWLQPGSESDEAIEYCKKNDIECIYNTCIILKNK